MPFFDAVDGLLPSWIARTDVPPSSRDPLGLQARAGANADAILPGLNVFTSRARYYPFLCWAVGVARQRPAAERLDAVLRLERLLVLCEALRHRDDQRGGCAYIGRRRGRRFVQDGDGAMWALPPRILKNQHTNGALRLYRTSLVDLGLMEETEDAALDVAVLPRGDKLAERFSRNLDASIVSWALGENDARKREHTLLALGEHLCLSAKPDGHERKHLLAALFGLDEEHALRRRESVRVLLAHRLLPASAQDGELASDLVIEVENDDADVESAEEVEQVGNWPVVRKVVGMPDRDELRPFQIAAAYELLAHGWNQLFASLLEPVDENGRLAVSAWVEQIGRERGATFAVSPATSWAVEPAVRLATRLVEEELDWRERGATALHLLLALANDAKLRRWLEELVTEPLVGRALDLRRQAAQDAPARILRDLVPELIAHHIRVSESKAKGPWLTLEGNDAVRADPRPFLPRLHALRIAQLHRLIQDLGVNAEDVNDAV